MCQPLCKIIINNYKYIIRYLYISVLFLLFATSLMCVQWVHQYFLVSRGCLFCFENVVLHKYQRLRAVNSSYDAVLLIEFKRH